MQPTILTNIKPGNSAFREEFFGPVALFFRVHREDEAIALANDSNFGLGGSVFTQDIARGKRVASQVDTGMIFVNHPTWTTAELPFGGIKDSGLGRELSRMGIHEFVNKKLFRVLRSTHRHRTKENESRGFYARTRTSLTSNPRLWSLL
jgi:succinate-semialdehyde dehydrogenase/glutarate-semialdehyde dehydrogenase